MTKRLNLYLKISEKLYDSEFLHEKQHVSMCLPLATSPERLHDSYDARARYRWTETMQTASINQMDACAIPEALKHHVGACLSHFSGFQRLLVGV